ncbi:hypothetical protein GQ457_05G018780 [Hibiscus cannabinus]
MLVKVGSPFDQTIKTLSAYMEKGDCIFDGGNEWYENTERREKEMSRLGLLYLGMGVSGGEEGARHGPSLMPRESFESYKYIADILPKVAAEVLSGSYGKADGYLVDKVLDKTGMKGADKWTVHQAVDLSVAAPTIAASLDSSYAQGMNLIRAKSIEKGWDLKLRELARIWKGSCIIRTILLDRIKKAYDRNPELANLPTDPKFAKEIIDSVYLSDLSGTRYFAMKIIDKTSLASRKKLSGAQTENEIMQLLDHPFLPIEKIMEEELVSLIHEHKLDMRENVHQWAVAIKVACRDYPHSRHLCLQFSFNTTLHDGYCDLCYCYVCDSAAPCEAWKFVRNVRIQNVRPSAL